jgi:hypothetical protein
MRNIMTIFVLLSITMPVFAKEVTETIHVNMKNKRAVRSIKHADKLKLVFTNQPAGVVFVKASTYPIINGPKESDLDALQFSFCEGFAGANSKEEPMLFLADSARAPKRSPYARNKDRDWQTSYYTFVFLDDDGSVTVDVEELKVLKEFYLTFSSESAKTIALDTKYQGEGFPARLSCQAPINQVRIVVE